MINSWNETLPIRAKAIPLKEFNETKEKKKTYLAFWFILLDIVDATRVYIIIHKSTRSFINFKYL